MPVENTNNLSSFETLVKKNDIRYNDRWSPTIIPHFEELLSQGLLSGMDKNLKKNIAYSLQYLQYIELQLKELNLHSVIITMLYKSFIITGVSIIEGIFYHLLKSNNLWKQEEWELEIKVSSNPVQYGADIKKVETHVFKKVPKIDGEMTLDSMIKKIEGKKLLDISHKAFPYIKRLKRLRNKVHLQIKDHPNDTDWWSFNNIDYLWMKYILHIILTNSTFELSTKQITVYNFIKCEPEDIERLTKDIQSKEEKIDK
jgi:hypothetical protein